jgi:NTP pyrophosphatase (non-canonical NTP hydrolase)
MSKDIENIFANYAHFVDSVTSDASKDLNAYIERLIALDKVINISRLDTAACGMSAEAGEFMEIVKKLKFQGKPLTDAEIFHMKREMGDILWYFMQACIALNTTPLEIIEMNVDKLEYRYPGGKFDVHFSENRKEGDV